MKFFTLVEPGLQQVDQRMRHYVNGHTPELQAALDQVLSSSGKMIRPTLVLLAAGIFGAEREKVINLAAAIELLHTATLVHDDLIDGALLRRGSPTLNTKWSPAATVLAGDYLFARAAELAAATDSIQVMKIFAKTLATIVSGEVNQLFTSKGLVSRDDYFKRIYAKTASLFESALHTTALISTQDMKAVGLMKQYGYEIGMAFQIVDDILDFTGEQTRVGKPVANDLRLGLATLPVIIYFETDPKDLEIRDVLLGRVRDEEQITNLVQKIRESGAVHSALAEAQHFIDRAVDAAVGMPAGQEQKALIEVANYIVKREI